MDQVGEVSSVEWHILQWAKGGTYNIKFDSAATLEGNKKVIDERYPKKKAE